MSTAVLEPVVEQKIVSRPGVTDSAPVAPESEEKKFSDPRPLLPVIVAGIISLHLAVGFVGAIVVWLLVRHSGIMAP
jgi:hypothetical protein